MQVKISIVADATAPPEGTPEVKVKVVSEDAQEMSAGNDIHIGKDDTDVTVSIPEGGTLTLTAENPPLVYDNEQKAAVPGEWPKDEEAGPTRRAAAPKSGSVAGEAHTSKTSAAHTSEKK